MELNAFDWSIIIGYFVLSLGIGIAFSARAGKNLSEYFVSGRSLPWWLAGTSMVATTFAADTPLAVTGLVAKNGLAGNWFWWAFAMGGMFTVFVYARMWRRAEVLTDVELVEVRYGGKPAATLRVVRAVYIALIVNPIIIGWVTGAMLTVLKETVLYDPPQLVTVDEPLTDTNVGAPGSAANEDAAGATADGSAEAGDLEPAPRTGVSDWVIIVACLATVGVYASLSGLWGVAVTDFIQFFVAMTGCVMLAVVAVNDERIGGIQNLTDRVNENFGDGQAFRFLPDFSAADPWMPLHVFFIYLFVQWWATWYPGAEPGGGGYIVQRMASCKDERHALLATLWYQLAHYCIRPWPWLLVAFVALAMFPEIRQLGLGESVPGYEGAKADMGFAMVMREVSPHGLRGLILVTFFAAFMSTISTQMNWGASYLVCDVYQRFAPNASQKQLTKASRVVSLLVLFIGGVAAYLMRGLSVEEAWKMLAALGAGTGAVFMLRWFWWRINAWSEIAAMFASLGYFSLISRWVAQTRQQQLDGLLAEGSWQASVLSELGRDEVQMLVVGVLTIVTWLLVTFLTPAEKDDVLVAFYRKVRPGGIGWRPIARMAPDVSVDQHLGLSIMAAILGSVMIYLTLPAVGWVLFGEYTKAAVAAGGAAACGIAVYRLLKRIGWAKLVS